MYIWELPLHSILSILNFLTNLFKVNRIVDNNHHVLRSNLNFLSLVVHPHHFEREYIESRQWEDSSISRPLRYSVHDSSLNVRMWSMFLNWTKAYFKDVSIIGRQYGWHITCGNWHHQRSPRPTKKEEQQQQQPKKNFSNITVVQSL